MWILAGVATLGIGVYVGSYVRAQQGGQAPAPARAPLQTRVGLVNIAQVIKNYQKFKAYQEAIKREIEPLNKEIEKKKTVAVNMKTEMEKPETPQAKKDQLEKDIKRVNREMQDMMDEANKNFSKKSLAQLEIIYRDVETAVTTFARSQGFELIFQYSDGVDPTEKYSPAMLQQKLGNQACIPIYSDDRMNITAAVTDMLNRNIAAAPAPAASGTPATKQQ
jgi:Skp family chaperone for outer membrane proteins